jgi:hypothetical protein
MKERIKDGERVREEMKYQRDEEIKREQNK